MTQYMIRNKPRKPRYAEINGIKRTHLGDAAPIGEVAIIEECDDTNE